MRDIDGFTFPETPDEAREWQPYQRYRALASTALVVATTRIEGCWKAYCMGVPGMTHDNEWREVLAHGDELEAEVAKVIFPELKEVPYAS